jgi:3-dehydroquinate synthetase
LPTEKPAYPRNAYLEALRVDKKMSNSRIDFVVLRGIGRAETVRLTPREVLPLERRGSRASRAKHSKRKGAGRD